MSDYNPRLLGPALEETEFDNIFSDRSQVNVVTISEPGTVKKREVKAVNLSEFCTYLTPKVVDSANDAVISMSSDNRDNDIQVRILGDMKSCTIKFTMVIGVPVEVTLNTGAANARGSGYLEIYTSPDSNYSVDVYYIVGAQSTIIRINPTGITGSYTFKLLDFKTYSSSGNNRIE